MKLWDKGTEINKLIETFTVGRDTEMDLFLAEFDVLGSLAHIRMLETIGLLSTPELLLLTEELRAIYSKIKENYFVIEEGIEDIHSQIELMLTRKLGEAGKKIHSGRSRNDQVLLDLKLFTRSEIKSVVGQTFELFKIWFLKVTNFRRYLCPDTLIYRLPCPPRLGCGLERMPRV